MTSSIAEMDPLVQNIHASVRETIIASNELPEKEEVAMRWMELVANGELDIENTDQARPYIIALQGLVEQVLGFELNKNIQSVTGVIHTPMPSTPLCVEGNISTELVASIPEDDFQRFTIKDRATTVRDFLFQGGHLFVAYPEQGLLDRSEEQQEIYKKALANFPTLFDRPLDCKKIDDVGAFYLFRNLEGKLFAFAISINQEGSEKLGRYQLWFDEVVPDAPVFERVSKVLDSLKKVSEQPFVLSL